MISTSYDAEAVVLNLLLRSRINWTEITRDFMRLLFLALAMFALSSCASSARPNFVNGQYFMMGDKNCKRYVAQSANRVSCYNSKGDYMGYRNAMTLAELRYYSNQMTLKQQETAQFLAEINAGNARLQQQTQQMLQSAQSYTPPTVTPISPGGSVSAYCTNAGNVMSCRSPLPAANFTCIQAGDFYHCRPRG